MLLVNIPGECGRVCSGKLNFIAIRFSHTLKSRRTKTARTLVNIIRVHKHFRPSDRRWQAAHYHAIVHGLRSKCLLSAVSTHHRDERKIYGYSYLATLQQYGAAYCTEFRWNGWVSSAATSYLWHLPLNGILIKSIFRKQSKVYLYAWGGRPFASLRLILTLPVGGFVRAVSETCHKLLSKTCCPHIKTACYYSSNPVESGLLPRNAHNSRKHKFAGKNFARPMTSAPERIKRVLIYVARFFPRGYVRLWRNGLAPKTAEIQYLFADRLLNGTFFASDPLRLIYIRWVGCSRHENKSSLWCCFSLTIERIINLSILSIIYRL